MKQKLPLNSKKEIFRWGPAPGKFFYMSDFNDAIYYVYPKIFSGFAWPKGLFLLKQGRMLWMNEFAEIRKAGAKIFLAYMLPEQSRLKLRYQWKKIADKINEFEKRFSRLKLTKLSDDKLYQLGKEFYDLLVDFWVPTVPMELGNYGSDYLLEEKLKKYILNKIDRKKALEILTAPEELSFYQKEEIALSKTKDLRIHQKQYFWLHNSYNGTKVLPLSFFQKRKKKLPKDLENKLNSRLTSVKKEKLKIKNQFGLAEEIMDIARALSYGVAWQDERKKHIFIYLHYKDLFLKEVARRKGYEMSDLQNASTLEVIEAIKKDISRILQKREKEFGFFCRTGRIQELNSTLTKKYWKKYGEEKIKTKVNLIKGIVASAGKRGVVKGLVKIIFDPFKADYFKEGDILVAPMTTPEYIFLMKKSSVIITDAGGLTSHAAIVSRELGIPCIVGTKIATQVLKDGDLVEVDAEKGIVKILKKI